MKRAIVAAACLALAATAAPAHADPTTMNYSPEFVSVSAGQTKAKVESNCVCTGVKTTYTVVHNGNSYTAWDYLTPVGNAYIMFRTNNTGDKIVGYLKYWCVSPAGYWGQPDGNCGAYQT